VEALEVVFGNEEALKKITEHAPRLVDGSIIEQLQAEIHANKVEIDAKNSEISTKVLETEKLQAEIDAKDSEISTKVSETEKLLAEIDAMKIELSTKNSENLKLQSDNNRMKADSQKLTEEIQKLRKRSEENEVCLTNNSADFFPTRCSFC
jgi:chromosome segregation ATPase